MENNQNYYSANKLTNSALLKDIDDLSRVTTVKAPHTITSSPVLSSPLEFTSQNLNSNRRSYSKRFQSRPLASEEICQRDNGGKRTENDSENIPNYKSRSSSSLIHCGQGNYDNGSGEDMFSGPFGCIKKYLVGNAEVEYEKTNNSLSYNSIELNHCPNSNSKFASKDNGRQDAEETSVAFSDNVQFGKQDFHENTLVNKKLVEKDANNEGNELHSSSKDHRPRKVISYGIPEFLSQPISPEFGYQDGLNETGEAACKNYKNKAIHVTKGQRSCGLQRRRLQFGEDDRNIIENTPGSWNPSNAETDTSSPASLVYLDVLGPPALERTATSACNYTVNSNQPISTISIRRCGNSRSTVPKPSGIGLHLNSILSPKPSVSTGVRIISNNKGCPEIQKDNLVACSSYYPKESINNGSISLKIGGIISNSQIEEVSDSHCPEFGGSDDPASLKKSDYQATPFGKRKLALEQGCAVEELSEQSLKKKSRKALAIGDGDGCKSCNCKKTKCLKLYCDCFAAGIFCSGPCFCEGCFNRPEYVDTVLQAREQIESKNPLAFAPKIVEQLIDSHVDSKRSGGTDPTPSSARHKRGCKCKKSMCVKKYCECYQNNVGCSSGCKCEGCKNVYGKKEDFETAEDAIDISISEASDENVEVVAFQDCFLQNEPSSHHNMTPVTPSFPLQSHGKDGSKSKFVAKRYLPSPEADTVLMPNSGGSVEKDGSPYHLEFNSGDADTEDGLSPTYNRLLNEENSSKLPSLRDQLSFESGDVSSASFLDRYESPFTTPIGQFGTAKVSKAGLEEKLEDVLEDEMPEILKDPINVMQISSPIKKRVSPPRFHGLRRLGSSVSSAGVKSGRKFILRSLPSFSPITPCIDGKDSSSETKS